MSQQTVTHIHLTSMLHSPHNVKAKLEITIENAFFKN